MTNDLTPQQLEELIIVAVEKALEKKEVSCACNLPPEARRELGHFMGVLRNMGGEGSEGYPRGIEIFRENHQFVQRCQRVCERTGSLIWGALILGILGILGTITTKGFVAWLKGE